MSTSISNIKVIAQYIKNFSFNTPTTPELFLQNIQKPDIEISINIDAKKIAADLFELILEIKADAKSQGQQFFMLDISYAGLFNIKEKNEELLEQILLIYCPNLLFPFVRRIISNTTIDSNFPPLMLDLIDFSDLYQKRKVTKQNLSETKKT